MFPDLGLMELMVIGVTALIVVGPKDLPVMFRNVGRFMGRMRGMARDFQRAMNDAADETGMRDVERDLRSMTSARKLGLGEVEDAARSMTDWKGSKPDAKGANAAAGDVREAAARRAAEAAETSDEPEDDGPPDPAPETAPEPAREAAPEPIVEPPAKAAAR